MRREEVDAVGLCVEPLAEQVARLEMRVDVVANLRVRVEARTLLRAQPERRAHYVKGP